MIDALAAAVREALGLAVQTLLPLFAVAAGAAIAIGLLCAALGIRDAAPAQIARALAVILALAALVDHSTLPIVEFAARSWSLELGQE